VNDLEVARTWAGGALAAIEAARSRIDDLNVYPVPDGDTGTNLTLTVRAIRDALEETDEADRATVAHRATRAALMGARGNSGVIFSQIVRGAAESLGNEERIDPAALARALRSASDAAYRAVRRPVEGTMLTVVRELADEAEDQAQETDPVAFAESLLRRGEEAVARTPTQLEVLREAGVVDAGGAGLLEIVRGIAGAATGATLPEPPVGLEVVGADAIHLEPSRFRYCTVFVVEGAHLDSERLEVELERLGDSLLVVGDETALKVHVHTDDPGAALSLGTAAGSIAGVEIADMHEQTQKREQRLLRAVPDPPRTAVVAVVAGEGNRRLFENLGAAAIVEGGPSMNPPTSELLAAIESVDGDEVIVLPNDSNVVLAAEQAAGLASRPVEVVPSGSIPAGLAALVAFDPTRTRAENASAMHAALAAVATGEVALASRDARFDGVAVRAGEWIGLADGRPVAAGARFDDVATAVAERLLAEPREVLTLLTGADEPDLEAVLARLRDSHPDVEVEVQPGGQPHYPLLLSAE
jgi:DAK2 domain fusion protein YloV